MEEYVTIFSAIIYDNNEERNAEETKTSCSKKATRGKQLEVLVFYLGYLEIMSYSLEFLWI